MTAAARMRVTGVVQGVGFRPFVFNLAARLGLTGWVNNASDGVHVHAEGDPDALARFSRELRELAPAQSVIESLEVRPAEAEGFEAFEIRASAAADGELTLVSPDIATCAACSAELQDPADRRYRYPFTNCTNCGPRFTIIDSVPYDRPATSMRDFPMCPQCMTEYEDPGDRRFHAQPNACHVCGPRLYLNAGGDAATGLGWTPAAEVVPRPHRDAATELQRTDAILSAAATMLAQGHILALKGLGGFHLACDATNETAVARLRDRKRRWGKPFAVMFPSLDAVRSVCDVGDEEARLLEGSVRPIVLLRIAEGAGDRAGSTPGGSGVLQGASAGWDEPRSGEGSPAEASDRKGSGASEAPASSVFSLAPSVAPGLAEIGVMLPYTPLHHLLLEAVGRPLVMTSGNLSDEPIATGNAEALERLASLADGFLLHDRGIRSRYDDSVARVMGGRTELVRRARGYAPFPLAVPGALASRRPSILAAGPEQKNTFCLTRGRHAFVSQHIGDLETAEALEHYESTIALYERLFRVEPELVAYDLHPEYLSTKHALGLGLPAVGVQHHHAHIASVTGEHGVSDRVVGIAYDGTGYGSDGTIWGGEVLLADWRGFTRFAHLRCVPMPGGPAAIRRPARMALGLLLGLDRGLLDHPGLHLLRTSLTTEELTNLPTMVDRGVGSPLTSSMGRLFDSVAALTGVRFDAMYEGQAAIELEALADPAETGSYRFDLVDGTPTVIDPLPVVEAVLDDVARGETTSAISARFHRAVVAATVEIARRAADATDTRTVAVAGGVFMNRLVLDGTVRGLERVGLTALAHRALPVNDGGIAFGQAVVALAGTDEV